MAADRARFRHLTGSVRFRITVVAASLVAFVLAVVSVFLVFEQRRQLTAALDESLVQRAEDVTALVIASAPDLTGVLVATDPEAYAQVVDDSGDVVAATPNITGMRPLAAAPIGPRSIRTIAGLPIDDDEFRVVSRRADTAAGSFVIHVAANYDDVGDSTRVLSTSLTIVVPIVTALLALLTWWLVGRTLSPVEAIRREVSTIGGRDLQRRVPNPPGDDEIARLAGTMNEMLERLEQSARRQQAFVGDASHELRTPLTRIRTELEVALAAGASDHRNVLESVLEETVALQRLVADLLYTASSDAGAFVLHAGPVDLDDVVLREAHRIAARGRVRVDTAHVSGALVAGDRALLDRAVANLADNAERHAASLVRFELFEAEGMGVLRIDDDGPGIPQERRSDVFERFVRVDDARSRSEGGTGLGLAIVRDIVHAHGGSISVADAPAGGARFVVRLPLLG